MRAVALAIACFVAFLFAYDRWRASQVIAAEEAPARPSRTTSGDAHAPEPGREGQQSFSCEGKTRCMQMHSCAEATFYLRNCPNVKIDGDDDGIPCEDQLCGNG